jgi:hypothetical protein
MSDDATIAVQFVSATALICNHRSMGTVQTGRTQSGISVPGLFVPLGAVVGLVLGVLTLILQGVLPGDWSPLANSGGVWLLGTAAVGTLAPSFRWAATTGVVTLLATLAGYYITAIVWHGTPESTSAMAVWAVAALIGGPVYGAAGFAIRRRHGALRVVGVALLSGFLVSEAVYFLLVVQNFVGYAIAESVVAVCIVLVLPRGWREQAQSVAAGAFLAFAAFATLEIINRALIAV